MTTKVTIKAVKGANALHHTYPGQTNPQDVYVELDCRSGVLTAAYNAEIGNAVTFAEVHGHVISWQIPALKTEAANELLEELAEEAQQILYGYSSVWDGNNHIAHFTQEAEEAAERAAAICHGKENSDDAVNVWDAADWFGGLGDVQEQCRTLGITADTTDAELEAIETREAEEAEASGQCDEIDGLWNYLKYLRSRAE